MENSSSDETMVGVVCDMCNKSPIVSPVLYRTDCEHHCDTCGDGCNGRYVGIGDRCYNEPSCKCTKRMDMINSCAKTEMAKKDAFQKTFEIMGKSNIQRDVFINMLNHSC